MDPALEEAASMSGARTGYALRKITLPLMLPMLLATWMYAFIGTLDDFETPLLVGLPAQIYLLPTVIYFTAYLSQSLDLAAAYATIFLDRNRVVYGKSVSVIVDIDGRMSFKTKK